MPLHFKRPRCGATNRKGEPCRQRVVDGHWRCRHHGGLSTGPRRRFAVTEAQCAAEADRIGKIVDRLQEGRRLWLAGLKARGEKAPCGRKPKGYTPPALSERERLDRMRDKADARRRQAPYRRFKRDCERDEQRRAVEACARAERRRIEDENDNPAKRPDETWEENAMRFACIMERRRREQRSPHYQQVESKARAGGFYRDEPVRFTTRPERW